MEESSFHIANLQKVSYLRARDPSVISWSHMYQARENVKQNLNRDFQQVSDQYLIEDDDDQCIKVFLRIKNEINFSDLYKVEDNFLISRIPQDSSFARNGRENDQFWNKYEFSKIFGPDSRQEELFDGVVKPKILNFINGRNCTLMAYGASGAGKTYTMIGTAEAPGIIPRALEYLFRTLPQLKHEPDFKVNAQLNKVDILSPQGRELEVKNTQSLLGKAFVFEEYTTQVNTYKQMQGRLSNNPFGQIGSEPELLGVWVSFAEIYNELIHDLLMPPTKGHRPTLKLGGSSGEAFIRGLRRFYVKSGLEAYGLLQYGLQNLKYAGTALNSHSSRSHSIFSIVLVQASRENPAGAVISVFNFCDLAGSERSKKTMNVGSRLKESGNINTSLLVLGRCLKNIREGQINKDHNSIPPFRDSKLTQLFQNALSGHEDIMMMVNINPVKRMFDETQHVLNFSAVAKKIIIEDEPQPVDGAHAPDQEDELAEFAIIEQEYQYFRELAAAKTLEVSELNQEIEILRDSLSEAELKLSEVEEQWAHKLEEAVEAQRNHMLTHHDIFIELNNRRIERLEKKNKEYEIENRKLREELNRLKYGDSSSSEAESEEDGSESDVICLDDTTDSIGKNQA